MNAYEHLTVFSKGTMIQVKSRTRTARGTNLKTCTVDIEANRINIENIRNKDWYLSEEYKGDPADISIEVELYETWYTATQTGTYYNYITKKTYPQYQYDRHERKFQTLQLKTVNGKASFEFAREKEKGYLAILRCKTARAGKSPSKSNFYTYYYDDYTIGVPSPTYRLEKDKAKPISGRSGAAFALQQ